MAPQFSWDRRKAVGNEEKHGVMLEEAASVFRDPTAAIFDDDRHSDDEYRELIVGHSERHRLLIVSFAERDDIIRIISARRANKKEREDYEQYRKRFSTQR
ncbi:MAG: BrnT family toxin [Caldilineaceae bacterium]|nr:BrnT family toxin [Caldilineaceae bacterium]